MELETCITTQDKYDYIFKIVLVGDSGVGKTNLLSQLTKQEFSTITPPTIGVEFATISFKIGDDIIKAQIWDTAGQERYRAITAAYYRGTKGALILYDITQKRTLTQSINHWLIQLKKYSKEDIILMLIGNKSDLEDQRDITEKEGEALAKENNLVFFETSALSGSNVKKVFYELIKTIYEKNKIKKVSENKKKLIIIENLKDVKKKKNNCC